MPVEKGTAIVVRPGDPEYEASRLQGFRVRWVVAREYEIKDRILGPASHAPAYGWWRDYYPAVHKNIPIELANIQEGNETALLAFTQKYGLLGFTNLLPFSLVSLYGNKLFTEQELLSSQGFHNDLPEKDRLRIARDVVRGERQGLANLSRQCGLPDKKIWKTWVESGDHGDPLPWVWAHIRTLTFCRDLGDLIENESKEKLISFLRQYQWEDSRGSRELYPILEVAIQHKVEPYGRSKPKDWTVFEFAKHLRRDLITRNIYGLHPTLEPEGNRERIYYEFRSLIEMAYWHLSNLVQDGNLKRCKREGCGGFFVQSHGGMNYCPEPKTPKGESNCAVLDRSKRNMKKYREKLRRKRETKS
jgi:hypothetical protein